jgi:hypothetical protein
MKGAVLASGSRGTSSRQSHLRARWRRGHSARLVAPKSYAALSAGRGAEFHPLPIDVIEEMRQPESEALFAGGGNPIAFVRWLREAGRKATGAVAPATLDGAAGSDLIVATGLMNALGAMVAERLGVPCVHAWRAPILAGRRLPVRLQRDPRRAYPAGRTAPSSARSSRRCGWRRATCRTCALVDLLHGGNFGKMLIRVG